MHERALVSEAVALASAGQPVRIHGTPHATYAPCYASGGVDEDQAQALTRGLRRVPTGGWLLGRDTEFHAGDGLVVQVDRGGRRPHVFLSTRHRAHLAPLRAFDVAWHAFAG
ncbi:hypothetical protein [Catellatospora sp. NPDC049133]|uniref:hypothetical protein n=1 Tax=Catellatospora sp. NPDC049133 TaxID=3155499 RepID=UPI0033DC1C69